MTISTTSNRKTFAGNDVTTAFSFDRYFLANADLVVLLVTDATGVSVTQVLDTDYTVSGAGNPAGGTVTMVTAPATGETLVVYRDPALTQGLDLVDNDSLPAETLEQALDRLTMIAQRLDDRVDRSFVLSDSDTSNPDLTIPSPVGSMYLRWNTAGTALELQDITNLGLYAVSPFAATLLDDTTANAFLTTLGAGATGITLLSAATAAAARSTLELGTAALVDTGTSSGNVPTVGSNGAIPNKVVRHLQVRQTVLSAAVDSAGAASFFSAGSGLACNLSATATAVRLAFAAGFDAEGAVDYVGSVEADATGYWSSLTASKTNFLYVDRDASTGALTAGATLHPPQYDYAYDRTKCALLNFEGSDASTSMIDAYGNTWSASGNAQIDTAQFKFGASSLLLDGTGDYVSSSSITSISKEDGFTIHLWVRWNTLPTAGNGQQIFRAINAGTFGVIIELINTAGTTRLTASLSSNGTSNDIASAATGSSTTWSTGTWYHIALTYDGATYRLYKDGVQDYSVASTSKICSITGFYVGATAAGAQGLNGWIDAFEILPYPLFTTSTSFTPPAAARTVEGNFFSIPEMKMYTIDSASASAGTNPGMTAVQRLFVGEAVTDTTSVTSAVNYALRGAYDSGPFAAAVNVTYTKSHKIGVNSAHIDNKIMFRESASYRWGITEQATGNTRNTLYIRSAATNVGGSSTFTTAGAQSTNPITSADWRVLSSRGF